MTSKHLLSKLMRENMRHRSWMIALSVFVQLMLGPIFFLYYLNAANSDYSSDLATKGYLIALRAVSLLSTGMPYLCVLIAIVGAIIVAVAGFSHLYSRRMTDLYNSVPVKRSTQFWVLYLNGFIIWAVPAIVSTLSTLIIALITVSPQHMAAAAIRYSLRGLALSAFAFFSVYHVSLLAVSMCGTVINALINIAILGLEAAAAELVLFAMAAVSFETFCGDAYNLFPMLGLSPLASPFALTYLVVEKTLFERGSFVVIASVLLTIINLALAIKAYQVRKSELAEQGVTHKPLQMFFLITSGFFAGIVGAEVFSLLPDSYKNAWALFGCIIAGILTIGVLEIVHKHVFKSFFDHKITMGVVILASFLTFLSFSNDWYGYDTYIPDENNISGASFHIPFLEDDGKDMMFSETGEYIGWNDNSIVEQLKKQPLTLTDASTIHKILEQATSVTELQGNTFTMYARVQKKFGGSYYKCYTLPATEEIRNALAPAISNADYMNNNYKASSGLVPMPDSISVSSLKGDSLLLTGDDMKEFYNTYCYEFREHYSMNSISSYVGYISFELRYNISSPSGVGHRNVYMSLPENFTNSIALLKKFFPQTYWSIEDMDYVDWTFNAQVENVYPTESVKYAYFGVEGYPTLNELQNEHSGSYSSVSLTFPEDFDYSGLIPYLHIGYPNGAFNNLSDYVSVGYIHYIDTDIPVCIKKSDMPKDLIKELIVTDDSNQEGVYYE